MLSPRKCMKRWWNICDPVQSESVYLTSWMHVYFHFPSIILDSSFQRCYPCLTGMLWFFLVFQLRKLKINVELVSSVIRGKICWRVEEEKKYKKDKTNKWKKEWRKEPRPFPDALYRLSVLKTWTCIPRVLWERNGFHMGLGDYLWYIVGLE